MKGFTRLIPVMCGIIVGYVVAAITGNVSFAAVSEAGWIGVPGCSAEVFLTLFRF